MTLMSSLFPSFSSFSGFFYFCISVVVLAFLYFNGAHFLFFNKLWSFFHRDDFYDSYLDSARKDALDVERFKLMYGAGRVKDIQTVKDTHQAIKWSNSCSVALRTLGEAGGWVDWKNQKVDKPKIYQSLSLYGVFIAVVFLLVFFSVLSFNSESIVRFKESGVYAWRGEQGLRSFVSTGDKRWVFDLSSCASEGRGTETPLFQEEIDFLCEFSASKDYLPSLNSGLKFQHYFSRALLIYLVCLAVFLLRLRKSHEVALRLHREMYPCHCKK